MKIRIAAETGDVSTLEDLHSSCVDVTGDVGLVSTTIVYS